MYTYIKIYIHLYICVNLYIFCEHTCTHTHTHTKSSIDYIAIGPCPPILSHVRCCDAHKSNWTCICLQRCSWRAWEKGTRASRMKTRISVSSCLFHTRPKWFFPKISSLPGAAGRCLQCSFGRSYAGRWSFYPTKSQHFIHREVEEPCQRGAVLWEGWYITYFFQHAAELQWVSSSWAFFLAFFDYEWIKSRDSIVTFSAS